MNLLFISTQILLLKGAKILFTFYNNKDSYRMVCFISILKRIISKYLIYNQNYFIHQNI